MKFEQYMDGDGEMFQSDSLNHGANPITFDFSSSSPAVPPSAILILDKDKNMLKNGTVLGPLKEGQTLNVECEIRGARPAPTVGWYRSGKRLLGEFISSYYWQYSCTTTDLSTRTAFYHNICGQADNAL